METANNQRFRELMKNAQSNGRQGSGPGMKLPDFSEAMDLVKAGLDYETLNEFGNSVVGSLVMGLDHEGQEEMLLETMMDHGLNPLLLVDEDLNMVLANNMCDTVVDTLTKKELVGEAMRDRQGGNLYHAMGRLIPWPFVLTLESHANYPGPDLAINACHNAWLDETQEDGLTPFIMLLRKATYKNEIQYAMKKGQAIGRSELTAIAVKAGASVARSYLMLGADLLKTDHQGLSAWDTLKYMDISILGENDERADQWRQTRALIEQTILERNTPVAQPTLKAKTGVRL